MLLQNCSYPRDGRVRREARALTAAGFQVSVIAPLSKREPRRETVEGVNVYRFPAPPGARGFFGYIWEYVYSMVAIFIISMRVFLHDGFDVIHAHHPPDAFGFIGAFYKLMGKRYVLDHHDLAPELYYARFGGSGNRFVYRVLVGLEKLSCGFADHVIATNQSYEAVEIKRGHVLDSRITIVRNGPDLSELDLINPDSELRKKGKTIIGYVGVTGTQDGVDYLLRALRHLAYVLGKKDFICIIVGNGNELSSLKSLARKLDITDFVVFTGWIDNLADVARYLSTMDICVAPEPSDPYNDRSTAAKVMEYMSFGKPIVAFDLPEHRFSALGAALYARPNDELDFAKNISLLMDNPAQCRKMGQEGRERIKKELNWQSQAKLLLEAYETIFSTKRER